MSLEAEFECSRCGGTETFWKTASTEMHLGQKVKWDCTECSYGIVRIDDAVDTSVA